ncbi:MAG: ATP-binding protein [Cyclobacteriaceae bacterium]
MIKKIAIIGPESTGKSEIAQQLAAHYQTEWVPEYARFYLDRLDGEYQQSDLLEIAKGQMAWEDDKAQYARDYLFCDTELSVIKIWSDHKYGNTDAWIERELQARKYDLFLLGDIDIAWTPDPQREHPKMRKHFFEVYENYLKERELPYAVVSGYEEERKKCAVEVVEKHFNSNG